MRRPRLEGFLHGELALLPMAQLDTRYYASFGNSFSFSQAKMATTDWLAHATSWELHWEYICLYLSPI